jgi:hypothetical protein
LAVSWIFWDTWHLSEWACTEAPVQGGYTQFFPPLVLLNKIICSMLLCTRTEGSCVSNKNKRTLIVEFVVGDKMTVPDISDSQREMDRKLATDMCYLHALSRTTKFWIESSRIPTMVHGKHRETAHIHYSRVKKCYKRRKNNYVVTALKSHSYLVHCWISSTDYGCLARLFRSMFACGRCVATVRWARRFPQHNSHLLSWHSCGWTQQFLDGHSRQLRLGGLRGGHSGRLTGALEPQWHREYLQCNLGDTKLWEVILVTTQLHNESAHDAEHSAPEFKTDWKQESCSNKKITSVLNKVPYHLC